MSAHSLLQPRIAQPAKCRAGWAQPRLHAAAPAAPLASLRLAPCRSAATEAFTFDDIVAANATPESSGVAESSQRPEEQQQQQGEQQQQHRDQKQQGQQQQQPGSVKCKQGDIVVGRVLASTARGAKVQLLDDSDVIAYMPIKEAPFHMRDVDEEDMWAKQGGAGKDEGCVPVGLVREFKVVAIQQESTGIKSGQPLLSAREIDQDLMWRRAAQIMQVCVEFKENVSAKVDGANTGGLTSRLTGLNLFIPVSQLEKQGSGDWWTEETMAAQYVGKELPMAVVEVVRKTRKVVASITKAKENDALRALEVGCLVTGTVRRVEAFGVFVGIDGCRESGLIHVSNISRHRVAHPQSVFQVGEKVKCILMGMDPDFSNISLSTAELEAEEGDIITNRQACWDNAEAQAAHFQSHLQQLRDSGFDFEAYYREQGSA